MGLQDAPRACAIMGREQGAAAAAAAAAPPPLLLLLPPAPSERLALDTGAADGTLPGVAAAGSCAAAAAAAAAAGMGGSSALLEVKKLSPSMVKSEGWSHSPLPNPPPPKEPPCATTLCMVLLLLLLLPLSSFPLPFESTEAMLPELADRSAPTAQAAGSAGTTSSAAEEGSAPTALTILRA